MARLDDSAGRRMGRRGMGVLWAAMLCLLLTGSAVYGFNQDDLNTLMATHICPHCDLSGANLSGIDLSGKDLVGANLSGANLSGANLSGADVSGANLNGANLGGSVLSGTDLSGANLNGANIGGTNLDGSKLDNTFWTDGSSCQPGSIEQCAQ